VLEDVGTAPIGEPLRETLRLLAKLTLEPERFGPDDLQEARAVGVDDDALAEAMYVCALFNIIVRCANTPFGPSKGTCSGGVQAYDRCYTWTCSW